MKDVLVFTPVLRLEPETIRAIFALEWDGPISYLFQRDNPVSCEDPREQAIKNHLHQYQRGREAFLAGPYQSILIIESDIIPPRDTIKRLSELDVDLAYGCYVFQGSPVVNVFERYYADRPDYLKRPRARNIGQSLTVRGLWEESLTRGVVECSGGGLGCILIKRHVLKAVDFRIDWPTSKAHCDSYFTIDCYQSDYTMKADTRVICGHKTKEGITKWPEVINVS